jgi:hypothetical protein
VELELDDEESRATFTSGESLATVAAFYDRELARRGWRVSNRKGRRNEIDYTVLRGRDKGKVELEAAKSGGTRLTLEIERD